MFFKSAPPKLVDPSTALKGRGGAIKTSTRHEVSGRALHEPYPEGYEQVVVALGCFWGAERLFWKQKGVWVTAVGYAGGFTPNPTYREVCSGQTGHTEVVRIVYDPHETNFATLLKLFFEAHDPTQGMRQGNDVGTQYRSAIYVSDETKLNQALSIKQDYEKLLQKKGFGSITTEIAMLTEFFYAEEEHQQYLAKNPNGYCGLRGTGVECPA